MPTERMEEVEVLCGWEPCGRCAYPGDSEPTVVVHAVAPNSLTAARLRLADAAEAHFGLPDYSSASWKEFTTALAAFRTKRGEG